MLLLIWADGKYVPKNPYVFFRNPKNPFWPKFQTQKYPTDRNPLVIKIYVSRAPEFQMHKEDPIYMYIKFESIHSLSWKVLFISLISVVTGLSPIIWRVHDF